MLSNGETMSTSLKFKEYCPLDNAFKIKNVKYGITINMDDFNIMTNQEHCYTFFKLDKLYYVVMLDLFTGEFCFFSNDQLTINKQKYISPPKITEEHSLFLFKVVAYIVTEFIKYVRPSYLQLSPEHDFYVHYKKLIDDEQFTRFMAKFGYVYTAQDKIYVHNF